MSIAEHRVQFYEQDTFLLEMVSTFLATGITLHAVCIVIATKVHQEGITQRLRDRGFDVEEASRQGTYMRLDAETALLQILVDGAADPERFAHIIEPLLERTALQGRSVRVFGEITALLWMQGEQEAALDLEDFWNTLLNRISSVTVLCAYPLKSFAEEKDGQFIHVCRQHAHVVPAESYTLLSNPQERLQTVAHLQQKAVALQTEISKNRDYTHLVEELLHLLTTLKTTNNQLDQASTTFQHFITKMGHEFRTGLTSIQGFSELLSTEEWGPEEVKEYATDILTDAKRLTHLIADILDLERMKLGKIELTWDVVDMNALVQHLATQTQRATSNHTLLCHLDETLPLIPGDQDKLLQVLSNLLSNAVKYSPLGGEIVLRSQRKKLRR